LVPAGPTVLSVFYGFPDHLIANWTGVSLATARRYKSGKLRPSAAVMRLFLLYRERRVLGPEWAGWLVKPDSIVDPDGNETTRSQLHSYFWVVQMARELAAARGEDAHREFYKLLG
jgi:hypothetical protein